MPKRRPEKPAKSQPVTAGGLHKLTLYLHSDELAAVEALSRRERCSKADAVRRAIRGFFKIAD